MASQKRFIFIYFGLLLALVGSCSKPKAKQETREKPAESINCSSYFDPETCNRSTDALNRRCRFDVEENTCVQSNSDKSEPESKPDDAVRKTQEVSKKPKEEINRQEAQEKATRLLKGRSIIDFCNAESIRTNNQAQKTLYEAIRLFMQAAPNMADYCATQYLALDEENILKAPHKKCMNTLLAACMDKSSYKQRFLATIVKLQEVSAQDESYIGSLIDHLIATHGPQLKYGVWGVHLMPRTYLRDQTFLIDSPQYKNIERTVLDPESHTNIFTHAWRDTIAAGEDFVDITSLVVPEERFMNELKSALVTLDKKERSIIVRVLFGANIGIIGLNVDVSQVYKELASVLAPNTKIKLYVGSFASSELFGRHDKKYFSWNHSKIVAVDDKYLITGGHNLFKAYHHQINPVHDVSLKIPGSLATVGHRFCDFLWNYTVEKNHKGSWWLDILSIDKYGDIASNQNLNQYNSYLDKYFSFSFENKDKVTSKIGLPIDTTIPEQLADKKRVIAAGRLSNAFKRSWYNFYNVADTAKLNMIKAAEHAIFISQQAIYPIIFDNPFNKDAVEALIRAMLRGVEVYILKSSHLTEIAGGKDAYNSGLSRTETFTYFYQIAKSLNSEGSGKKDILTALFRNFLILNTANGIDEVPNHAKVLIVDTKAINVGSHNLYDDSHAEFEVILRDSMLLLDYFAPFWLTSIRAPLMYEAPLSFDDFTPGEFVFVTKPGLNARSNFSLARVRKKNATSLDLDLDFLVPQDSIPIEIDALPSIYKIAKDH